jgi:hypothetical protein
MVILAFVAMGLFVVWPAGRICRRIGFSPWLGLFAIVPIANLALLWFVAISDWPKPPHSQRDA